jgi:hypothetical protein
MKKATAEFDTPINQGPELGDLKAKLVKAERELQAAEEELNSLSTILNPGLSTSSHTPNTTELDQLKARQQEPFARARFLEAKGAVLELKPRYEQMRLDVVRQLTDMRNRARLPLLKRFSEALDAAATIGDEILAFDRETVRLGGANPGHPFGQLIDERPYRQGEASRIREQVRQLERTA